MHCPSPKTTPHKAAPDTTSTCTHRRCHCFAWRLHAPFTIAHTPSEQAPSSSSNSSCGACNTRAVPNADCTYSRQCQRSRVPFAQAQARIRPGQSRCGLVRQQTMPENRPLSVVDTPCLCVNVAPTCCAPQGRVLSACVHLLAPCIQLLWLGAGARPTPGLLMCQPCAWAGICVHDRPCPVQLSLAACWRGCTAHDSRTAHVAGESSW